MKTKKIFTLLFITSLFVFVLQSCTTTKTVMVEPLPPLAGSWELTYIAGPQMPITQMFPEKVPTVVFDTTTNRIGGSAGCNSYSGSYKLIGRSIDLSAPMAATKMYCATGAAGETQFLLLLPKVNNYTINGDELDFKMSNQTILKFRRRM